jgi:molybdopterin synthase catalytic subunit
MTKAVNIRVLFFGAARDAVEANQLDLEVEAPATVSSAFQTLKSRFSRLERFGRSLLFAVNQEYATPDTQLNENDELAVFPPVSGGSTCDYRCPHDFFELTTEPIDVGQVARRVVLPECGATVSLDGYAREWTRGKRTLYLVYEAYDTMALTEMQHRNRAPDRPHRDRRNERRDRSQRPSPSSRIQSLRVGHQRTQTHRSHLEERNI